jgi:TonB family protein
MPPRARASDSLTDYSLRQRKAIILMSLAFIVFSALAHFLIGGWVEPLFGSRSVKADQQTPQRIVIDVYPHPTPAPTPTPPPPRPHPSVEPRAAASPVVAASAFPHTRVVPPHTRPDGGNSDSHRGDGTNPTASPVATTPEPTSTPSVPQFAPCRMLHKVVPRYPEVEKSEDIQGTVVIVVEIGPDGQVLSARTGQSSGSGALDDSALTAARASTYACPPDPTRPAADLYQVIYTFEVPQ